jgi:hypothetical protein
MAKDTNKEPGRFAQIWRIWKLTIASDKKALPYSLLALVGALAIGITLSAVSASAGLFAQIAWIVTAVLGGVLAFSIVLSKRAEAVAYGRIEGQPGAVGAVLSSALKRGWSGTEEPVNVNPRTQDLVYRVSGPGGVVLIAEGHRSSVSRLVEEEKRKLSKVTAGVPVTVLWVCSDEHSVKLSQVSSQIFKLKKVLKRAEISEVNKRLATMKMALPVPKGIDPQRMRAQRR